MEYGCHLSKIILSGDSRLLQCAMFFAENCARQIDVVDNQPLGNILRSVKNVRLACVDLASSFTKPHGIRGQNKGREENYQEELESRNGVQRANTEWKSYNLSMKMLKEHLLEYGMQDFTFIPQLPRSLLCYGTKLTKLILSHCGLESLPVTFGSCFPRLRVSMSGSYFSFFRNDFAFNVLIKLVVTGYISQ